MPAHQRFACYFPAAVAHWTSTLHRGGATIRRWRTKLARHVQRSLR